MSMLHFDNVGNAFDVLNISFQIELIESSEDCSDSDSDFLVNSDLLSDTDDIESLGSNDSEPQIKRRRNTDKKTKSKEGNTRKTTCKVNKEKFDFESDTEVQKYKKYKEDIGE